MVLAAFYLTLSNLHLSLFIFHLTFTLVVQKQVIFTFEVIIKVMARGYEPSVYFTDYEEGPWNALDFVIVLIGLLDLLPMVTVFSAFPTVALRLLRLLRIFRVAKTLPRLRSIVEALLSGLSAVGWICVLIATFNFIVSCMCTLLFRENDPFHFGSIGRSMFTIQRISTLDSWDEILSVQLYGCDE